MNDFEFDVSRENKKKIIKKARSRTTFKTLNIPIGAELVFLHDPNTKCKVLDNVNGVEYSGKKYSLSGLAKELLGYDAIHGATRFIYEGEILWNRRLEMEKEE